MNFDPLYAFIFAGLFSPGPNVILLISSGARFGARATWPHIAGVALGVGIIGAITGFGIGAILISNPQVSFVLKCLAFIWILWMAIQLWKAGIASDQQQHERPFKFLEAVLFQWINPKIWAVAIAATAGYSIGLPADKEAIRLGLAFTSINIFVCIFWTYFGDTIARILKTDNAWLFFKRTMAILLGLSAAMVFV